MAKFRSGWLIAGSLALLAVFETLWLGKVWQEQYEGLKQETDYVFQRAVAALQDSLVQRGLARDGRDSCRIDSIPSIVRQWLPRREMPQAATQTRFETKTNMIIRFNGETGDRLGKGDSMQFSKMQVIVAAQDGKLPGMDRLLLHLPTKIQKAENGENLFQFEQDTVSLSELETRYRTDLTTASIDLPFRLRQANSLPFRLDSAGLHTQPAFAGILTPRFYAAVFPEYRAYVLRKALPAAAFALLLFGVTAAAFWLIYKNLRAQQRLARLKNEFISNITHELKTPITTVGVALEALSDFDVLKNPGKAREYLAHSKLELDRLTLLVDKVLRLSMFEEQQPLLQPEIFDLSAAVRQVTAAMTLQAERAGAQLHFDDPGPCPLRGDRLHLSSVVFNLLDNALKYCDRAPQIHVSLEKTPDVLRLAVRDNGIGIPPEYRARVFEKFFRVPSDNRHDVKGHGLGLSYVAKVVQQHGGRIWVESAAEGGSVFWVELPVAYEI